MRRLAKVGLGMIVAGAVLVGLPFVWYEYPTHVPVQTKLPLTANGTLSHKFRVRTSELYNLRLACLTGGELNYSITQFLSSNPTNKPQLDCQLSLRISQNERAILTTNLTSLRPAMASAQKWFWHLGYIHIPEGGVYLLEVTNHSDLTHLKANEPTIDMDIGGPFYVSAIYGKLIGTFAGGLTAFIGLILFLFGLLKKKGKFRAD